MATQIIEIRGTLEELVGQVPKKFVKIMRSNNREKEHVFTVQLYDNNKALIF